MSNSSHIQIDDDALKNKMVSSSNVSSRKGDGIFYQASTCYSDRKILLVATAYLISCLAVFVHYALTKHIAIKEAQSSHDPFTDGEEIIHAKAQLWFPTFAFATKHVIHLHLALLPLTMCRYSITRLSSTFLRRYFPFDDMMKCHIFLGYVLVGLVALAFTLFMIYYALLCTSGDQDFCNRFSSEIMITGYVVFALFMTVGVSSYYRNYNYQRFYRIHQIVFVAFLVSVMHTIDKIQRTQGGRSQAYKWFTMSLMIYITDRLTVSSAKGKHITTVVGYQALNKITTSSSQGNDNGIIILKLAKPQSFHFKPGHHVKMKISLIDNVWHPFTIASSPDSDILEFHINVNLEGSWTYKLLDLIRARKEKEDDLEPIYVELMGPFGNPVAHYAAHSDALLIGSGTGFVSGLSLLQQHIEQCVSLDPSVYRMQKEKHRDLLERDGLLISTRPDNLESAVIASTDDRKQAVNIARNQIYKHVSMFVPFLLAFASFTLTLSWNTLAFEPFHWMEVTICTVTILAQVSFLVIAVKRGSFPTMKTCLDFLVLLLGMIGNVYWMLFVNICKLKGEDLFVFSTIALYISLRIWYEICSEVNRNTFASTSQKRQDFMVYDNLTFIWIVRTTDTVEEVLPLFERLWMKLEYAWGLDLAQDAFKLKIYCTDKNRNACQSLQDAIEMSPLHGTCELNFHRPNFPAILKEHSFAINAEKSVSSTILSFCGSNMLGNLLSQANVLNGIDLMSRGLTKHVYEIKIDSYGAGKKKNKTPATKSGVTKLVNTKSNEGEDGWNLLWESSSLRQQRLEESHLMMPAKSSETSSTSLASIHSLHTPPLQDGDDRQEGGYIKSAWPLDLRDVSVPGSPDSQGVGAAIRSQMRNIERRKAEIDRTIRSRLSTMDHSGHRVINVDNSLQSQLISLDLSRHHFQRGINAKRVSIDSSLHPIQHVEYMEDPRAFMKELVSSKKTIEEEESWSQYFDKMKNGTIFEMTFKDKYELGKRIGGGGVHTVVKEAILKQGNMKYAAKIIYKPNMKAIEKQRVEDEVKLLSEISHHNVYRMWDVFNEHDFYVIVSEYLSGGTLLEKILQKQYYSEAKARKAMTFLLSAVQHFHSMKIVHRDLRLENIMLASSDDDTYMKIIDFEFAKKAESSQCLLTQCGTPLYMAPEILQGTSYGSKVDLWSLGVVFYCILVGYFPFMSHDQKTLYRLIKKGKFAFQAEYWGQISLEARQFIECLLNTNPDKRFSAAQALDHAWIKADEMQTIDLDDESKALTWSL